MKIKVERRLSNGIYYVSFSAGDFTDDERSRFEKFGTPTVELILGRPGLQTRHSRTVTSINEKHAVGFESAEIASEYEKRVLGEIRSKMEILRGLSDDFTSSGEIEM